jgi:hypothetical protein
VKCDEGRPACQCCLSTGRICDGYGIWGGGGNRYEQRSAPSTASSPPAKLQIEPRSVVKSPCGISREEQSYFDYFMSRTRGILGIHTRSSTWTVVIVQACVEESALLHAILALGSAHHRKEYDRAARYKFITRPDQQELFLLRHYTKAIAHLQPQCSNGNKRSLRIVLMTCLLFYYLEILRGNYATSCTHLDNGLQLARYAKRPAQGLTDTAFPISPLDDSLFEALTRLQVLRTLAAHYADGYDSPPESLYYGPTRKFLSLQEAEFQIHQMWEGIHDATETFYRTQEPWSISYCEAMIRDQSFILAALSMWYRTYTATIEDTSLCGDDLQAFGLQSLLPYHTMVATMAAAMLSLDDQMIYDRHTFAFRSIVAQSRVNSQKERSLGMQNTSTVHSPSPPSRKHQGLVTDSGWISPLFYTALKCRDHHLRTEAADLLLTSWQSNSEDCFRSKTAAAVALEVIKIEEQGLFGKCASEQQGGQWHLMEGLAQAMPLAKDMRIERVEVVLPVDWSADLRLVCKERAQIRGRELSRVYNILTGVWNDSPI